MKKILEFNLPEDQELFELHDKAISMQMVIIEFSRALASMHDLDLRVADAWTRICLNHDI